MEDIIAKFGIDAKLIVAQVINVTLLIGLLSYFLYKPMLRMLAEREAKIQKGVEDAEAAGKALAEADEEKKSIVADAHKEAEGVAVRAKDSADEKAASIINDAEEKAAAITKLAEEKGADIKAQAHKDSEAEIAKMVVLAAEKVIKEEESK